MLFQTIIVTKFIGSMSQNTLSCDDNVTALRIDFLFSNESSEQNLKYLSV